MSLIERVKLALRISHNLLDEEIESCIMSARMELMRVGISYSKAYLDEDNLVNDAIVTFARMRYANDPKLAEGYERSFLLQADNLRKSSDYNNDVQ